MGRGRRERPLLRLGPAEGGTERGASRSSRRRRDRARAGRAPRAPRRRLRRSLRRSQAPARRGEPGARAVRRARHGRRRGRVLPAGDRRMIRVGPEDFDVAAELAALDARTESAGAVATFTGHVRAGDGLTALVLEHYPAMTGREIARHVAEAERRWPLLGVTDIHRIGRLVPGARIVFVAVAAGHRRAAFEACEFLMD